MADPLGVVAVGDRLPPLRMPAITRAMIQQFAEAVGDRNPIHLDRETARHAGFDDVFAHGMLSMAYLGRMLTDWVPQRAIRRFEVRFHALTPLGAEPECTAMVTSVKHDMVRRRLIDLQLTVRLLDGTVTVSGMAEIEVGAGYEDDSGDGAA